MRTRKVGKPVEGADGGWYQQVEILDDLSHLPPHARPPAIVWQKIKEGVHIGNDTSPTRQSLSDYHKSGPKNVKELEGTKAGPVAILCNGKSLQNHDLHKIPFSLFGMNRSFKGYAGYTGPKPDYYGFIDIGWHQRSLACDIPYIFNMTPSQLPDTYQIPKSFRMNPWAFDVWRDGVVPVNTGYACLQIAAYLGHNPIYILGMDYGSDRVARKGSVQWKKELHFDGTQSGAGLQTQPRSLEDASEVLKGKLDMFFVGSPENGSTAFPHLTFEEMLDA